ncbi:MAG: hypothetical protein IJ180_11450 [Bacteroidales bacterium]|nr:hypothetical protein [Bacteroidales bacterium]MBQ9255372.1 hypothetical protein [Bacteroidales bacterium]
MSFHKVLGNIKKHSIKEVINGNTFIEVWKNTKEKDYKECYSHEYCNYCCFCSGNNYNDTKNGEYLNGGENNCYLAKIRYETGMRLRNGEDILQGMTIEERIKKT